MCALQSALSCPLCAHQHFENVEKLCDRLIFVSTKTLSCPVCKEEVCGLDKLTIHLFSHVKIDGNKLLPSVTNGSNNALKQHNTDNQIEKSQTYKKSRSPPTKNKPVASANAPVKYVKIYPKLPIISLNASPIIGVTTGPFQENITTPLRLPDNLMVQTNEPTESNKEDRKTNVETNFICDLCGIRFGEEKILNMHKVLIHNSDGECFEKNDDFSCHLCNKRFKMKGSLMVHLRVVHYGIQWFNMNPPGTTTGDGTLSSSDVERSSTNPWPESLGNERLFLPDKNENKQWFCEVCEKYFTTKYFLKKHKRLHTGETPYACSQCNKTFTFQQSYHKHLLYHNDEKPHSCSYCGRAFKELSTLHNHQRIHTGEKPFSCETCGKCFRQRVSYLVHRRIHTGVMPYKCTACDKSFRYKVSQRTHKCPAQPPGTVVRQSGELLEKLKKKHIDNEPRDVQTSHTNKCSSYCDISPVNLELIKSGAKLSFEDTEAENFSLINTKSLHETVDNDRGNVDSVGQTSDDAMTLNSPSKNAAITDENMPSPSDILKNLCLSNFESELSTFANNDVRHEEYLNNVDLFYKAFNHFI